MSIFTNENKHLVDTSAQSNAQFIIPTGKHTLTLTSLLLTAETLGHGAGYHVNTINYAGNGI